MTDQKCSEDEITSLLFLRKSQNCMEYKTDGLKKQACQG